MRFGRKVKRMSIMWYRAGKVSRDAVLALVVYFIVWIVGGILTKEQNFMMMEDMIWVMVMIAEIYPFREIKELQTFCYYRKKQFAFCMLGEGVRAFIFGGIFRTALQVIFYSEYVKVYTEDASKEVISQYHQCPVWELFLVNIALFFIARLIMVFDSTRKYPVLDFTNKFNKNKKPVMSFKRKILRVIEYPVVFIGWFGSLMIFIGSYDFMLRNTLQDKMGMYLAGIAAILAFLFLLWRRFRSGKKMEM